jgi:transposase
MNKKYLGEFKQETVRQVVEKGYSVPDVSKRLGISDKSLYYWVSRAKVPASQFAEQAEIRQLKAQVKRLAEERNILKKAPCTLQASQRKVHVHKITTPCLAR